MWGKGGKEGVRDKMKKEVERKIKYNGFYCVLILSLSSECFVYVF